MDEDILWFVGGLTALFFVWILIGGPQSRLPREGVFIYPLTEVRGGAGYGQAFLTPGSSSKEKLELPPPIIDVRKIEESISNFAEKLKEVEFIHKTPLSSRTLIIDGFSGAKAETPETEYIRVVANSKNKFANPLTGLVLESPVTGNSAIIPSGSTLPLTGIVPKNENITLRPGERAIISSGKSPIGTSFALNKCSGYLGQFQKYTPELKRECPRPEDDVKNYVISDSVCKNFLENLPRCEIYRGNTPSNLSLECKQFISEKINYNSCVSLHKNDTDFYSGEWRIFLGKMVELWKQKQEIIELNDADGNALDAVTY